MFIVGGGSGDLTLYSHLNSGANGHLQKKNEWKNCHKFLTGEFIVLTFNYTSFGLI